MAEKDKRCQIRMWWSNAPCGRELYDGEHCFFHSRKLDKDAKLFQKKLDEIFKDTSVWNYDFSKFIFPEGIIFPRKIDKSIFFWYAVFQGTAEFSVHTFQGRALFGGTTFEKEAWFNETSFEGEAAFWSATFKSDSSFQIASFRKVANLSVGIFEEGASFSGATFGDALLIEEGYKENKQFSKKEVDFSYVKFSKPEKVSFKKVDLSRCRFLGTDLRKVEFLDVDWNRKRGRNRIYDEIEAEPETNKFDYPLIAQVYKRLRANYEENLNYAEAGDFHIGEMEMRRKGEKNPFNKGIIQLYKLLSNYGESYWRPLLFWILPILLLFPILFMYSGIEPVAQSQNSYLINYEFDASSISLNKEKVADYLKSFVYSLSVFSLVREKQYRPMNNLGHLWMVLESIMSPLLIAFFLLALRRRFRR